MKKLLIALLLLGLTTATYAESQKWTAKEESKISLFFSNFAEAFLSDFQENQLSDEELLRFSQNHIYKNRYKRLKSKENEAVKLIPAEMVDEISMKFFGKKVASHSVSVYEYPEADGDTIPWAHIYDYTYNQSDDTYTVKGFIIASYDNYPEDLYGDMTTWKKVASSEDFGCWYCFEGKIKTSPIDKTRYILLSYKKHETTPEEEAIFKKAIWGDAK